MSADQLDLLTPPEEKYQPRWLAFCRATGHDPDVFDGGRTGSKFIVWISQNLTAWRQANNVLDEWAPLTDDNHESFTAYLFEISATDPAPVTDSGPDPSYPPAARVGATSILTGDARHGAGETAGAEGIEPPTAPAVLSA